MTHGHRLSLACGVLVALVLPLDAAAQVVALGQEFLVNSYTATSQNNAVVAADADGDFVVVWQSDGQDGSGNGIFARRFSSAGASLVAELQVNTFTTNIQSYPVVGTDSDGDFVIAWSSPQDGHYGGIFARRFSSAGASLATEFQVNTRTAGHQQRATVALDADGDFVIAWESKDQDGDTYGAFARRFSSAGGALATEFQVNTHTVNIQNRPRVDTDDDGDFVVAWGSSVQDGSVGGAFARRFSSAGTFLATEFQINTYTPGGQFQATPALDADGDFVIAFIGPELDGLVGVFARRFSSTGDSLGEVFQVNSHTPGTQGFPSVATDEDGDFVIAWQSDSNQDGASIGVFARGFSSAGTALATEFQINTYTTAEQRLPSASMAANGAFVVAWQSNHQDGYSYGVFARRFGVPTTIPLDIDGNEEVEALTDGLLIVRYLFGFSGNALVNGAVGDGCANCDPAPIEAALDALGDVLNTDGDPSIEPLTDGLLIVRYLFGFTGNALINGAVGNECSRCDGPAIVDYLDPLTQ